MKMMETRRVRPPTGPWRSFEKDLLARVKSHQERRPDLLFSDGFGTVHGSPPGWIKADAALTDRQKLLAVEVEITQQNPDTNVGKYWLLERHHKYESVVLFHIFTPPYWSYPSRLEIARLYAEKMREAGLPFQYVPLDRTKDTDPAVTMREVWPDIETQIEQMFP